MDSHDSADPIIPVHEAIRFGTDCLMAAGALRPVAEAQARLLVDADCRGHIGHGTVRLGDFINQILEGVCDPHAMPIIEKETDSTALVNGQNGMGAITGTYCMELAIRKAKKTGVGWVSAKNCNHNGIEAYYCMMAIKEGLIGFAFSNGAPVVVPTRAKTAALGTNPIGMGAPGTGDDYFLLDIATSTVAMERIDLHLKNGVPIPRGWALDAAGRCTTNPEAAINAEKLMPLGGSEKHAGYKGTGLGLMVEILCGICSGSNFGPSINKWNTRETPADLGQCYIAIDPNCFAPGFVDRLTTLLNHIRNLEPADPKRPVIIPGDIEKQNKLESEQLGGIRYKRKQLQEHSKLCAIFRVNPMKDINGRPTHPAGLHGKVCSAECAKS